MPPFVCKYREECPLYHRHKDLFCKPTCPTLKEYAKPQQSLF